MTDRASIAAFGGSLRSKSLNTALLRAAATAAEPLCDLQVLDLAEIPLYNQDFDPGMGGEPLPPTVQALADGVAHADGLVIVSPEYNWGIPGYLKNAIDWISHPAFDSVLVGRPTLLMGASVGPAGTGRAQLALRQTLLSTRTPVLMDCLQVPMAQTRIDEDGVVDDALQAEIERLLASLVDESLQAREADLPTVLRRPVPLSLALGRPAGAPSS